MDTWIKHTPTITRPGDLVVTPTSFTQQLVKKNESLHTLVDLHGSMQTVHRVG